MLEMWMPTSYAWHNPMGKDQNLHGEVGRQNRELLCAILLFLKPLRYHSYLGGYLVVVGVCVFVG
jgi:hypothetical protein